MKQTPEVAVEPRRKLLTALGASALGLWGSSQLFAGDRPNMCPAQESGKKKDGVHQLAKIVGALATNKTLSDQFFGAPDKDAAKAVLRGKGLSYGRAGVECIVEKMHAARSSPDNPVQKACQDLNSALVNACMPCPDWPC